MKFGQVCENMERGVPVAVPDGFVDALLTAADTARADREIGIWQYWRIKAAARNPRKLAMIYAGVCDEAVSAGVVSGDEDTYGFDWDSLLAFIGRLFDLILKLF